MDKAEQNQAENTVKNGTAPNTSGSASEADNPAGASVRPETAASEGAAQNITQSDSAQSENDKPESAKQGSTAAEASPAVTSAATSPAESSPAASTPAGATALHVDAMRLDSSRAVYSTDLDPDDDYEEVVEEYATTDAPDGTHREERRITRTTHHPHGKGDQKAGTQKAGTQGNPDSAAEIIDAGEPETHTTTIRTVTRTVTDPPLPHAQQVPRREEPGRVGRPHFHAHVRGVRAVPACVRRAHHEHAYSGAVRRVPQHHSDDSVGPLRRRLLRAPVPGAAATLLHHAQPDEPGHRAAAGVAYR